MSLPSPDPSPFDPSKFNVAGSFINQLGDMATANARDKGFHDRVFEHDEAHLISSLALISSEVYEALKVFRESYDDTQPISDAAGMTLQQADDFRFELADIIIRTFDLSRKLHLNIGDAVIVKMRKNSERPALHGKRF